MPPKKQNQKTLPAPKQNILPPEIEFVWSSEAGTEVNSGISDSFKLSIGQTMELTLLVNDVFMKKAAISGVNRDISARLRLSPKIADKLALAICAKKLLVIDNEWFGGEVAKKIKALGADPEKFLTEVEAFKKNLAEEKAQIAAAKAAEELETSELFASIIKKEEDKAAAVKIDPEEDKRSFKKIFAGKLKDILNSKDYTLRIELNARLINYFLEDEEARGFQRDILDVFLENKELIGDKKIIIKNEKSDPTIGNWLVDYISSAGADEAVSSIKKAQYLTASPNMQALSEPDRELVGKMLKLFFAIKNFYLNAAKYDLQEIYIFPFTEEEQQDFLSKIQAAEGAAVREDQAASDSVAADISKLFEDKPEDRLKISAEKNRIVATTRQESDKVADELELALLNRKKHIIIACLEILAETGALDNLLAEDPRYQNLLFGYFKRNNLSGEQAAFKQNPYQAKYVQGFLKFVFLERLGLPDHEGARLASNLSNIFRTSGIAQYGQLAYLDLHDNKFNWTAL